ncbi:hypothetical protein NDU88_002622 [Pleurodeles waltl]|uniref:Uncharacterized protein n=1 Tax=Pleurodeles waltl TaxID=8319 RepID=A0AAV7UW95_PLEWA|nr:hypothetical protein NDU88_002622 [Pleurodeles waltl]
MTAGSVNNGMHWWHLRGNCVLLLTRIRAFGTPAAKAGVWQQSTDEFVAFEYQPQPTQSRVIPRNRESRASGAALPVQDESERP